VLKFLDIPKVVNFQYLTDITDKTQYYIQQMVSVLVSSAVDSSQGQTKHYEIGISCFSAAVRSKIKDLLTQNQDE
jgi:CDP-diacylglycerol pyrophosphatase